MIHKTVSHVPEPTYPLTRVWRPMDSIFYFYSFIKSREWASSFLPWGEAPSSPATWQSRHTGLWSEGRHRCQADTQIRKHTKYKYANAQKNANSQKYINYKCTNKKSQVSQKLQTCNEKEPTTTRSFEYSKTYKLN